MPTRVPVAAFSITVLAARFTSNGEEGAALLPGIANVKTSCTELLSAPTKLLALLSKTTTRPLALTPIVPLPESLLPEPLVVTLAWVVVFELMFLRKTSRTAPLEAFSVRLVASLTNATTCPLALKNGDTETPFPNEVPSLPTLTSLVIAVVAVTFLTNTSATPLVSPVTKLLAAVEKATVLPSALMTLKNDPLLPLPLPVLLMLTNVVIFVTLGDRVRTKISPAPLLSFATRLLAKLVNTTTRPSALIEGLNEKLLALPAPVLETLTIVVVLVERFRTKTSVLALLSVTAVRLVATLEKATERPSALSVTSNESPFPLVPVRDTLTSVVAGLVPRVRTNTSRTPFVSFGAKSLELLKKPTTVPSALSMGELDAPFPLPMFV